MKNALVVLTLAAFIGAACRAASPVPVPESLLACRKLPAESDRVHCYDAQIDKMSAVATPAAFGQETLPSVARPKVSPQDEPALLSSITALRPLGRATYSISLANGQVWRQEEASDTSLFFRVGDSVRIEKGTLGSYHMSTATTGAKNWIRVTRLQ